MQLFKAGDLIRLKPSSKGCRPLEESSLVLVTKCLPAGKRFFYGSDCSTGETHLWSYDQFYLVSNYQ